MKLKKLYFNSLIFSFLTLSLMSVKAADNLFFEGNLVKEPCTVLSDNKTLTVKFNTVDVKALRDGQKTEGIPFIITVSNCDNSVAKNINFLFKGFESDSHKGYLGININGKPSGIGIGIEDKNKKFIAINKDNSQFSLNKNENQFLFNAFLKAEPSAVVSKKIELGKFSSTATFHITYP